MGQSAGGKKKKTIFSKHRLKYSIWQQRLSKNQSISPDPVFVFETLHVTPRRQICLTQGVILSSNSNFVYYVYNTAIS